jgi:hypothetical protein
MFYTCWIHTYVKPEKNATFSAQPSNAEHGLLPCEERSLWPCKKA